MIIALTICMTASYRYAWRSQCDRLAQCLDRLGQGHRFLVILAGDITPSMQAHYERALETRGGTLVAIHTPERDGRNAEWNYQKDAQRLIARLRSDVFQEARRRGAELVWSLDSDVLPHPDALRASMDVLSFDGGYYGVAACPYPSQGGGSFLCGFGDERRPIYEDFTAQEAATLKKSGFWSVLAKHGWRRRGWFDFAYPGIGRGAVVPVDWCGFGATLMTRRVLDLVDFAGYDGRGTEDLYICMRRWRPAGVRIAAVAHCPASHVVRRRGKPGTDSNEEDEERLFCCEAGWIQSGDQINHLTRQLSDWIDESDM